MYKKGDIVSVNFTKGKRDKSLTKGKHLALVVSNDKHNASSDNITVIPLSSKTWKRNNKFNIFLAFDDEGLSEILYKDNICMINQVTTIDNSRVVRKIAHLDTRCKKWKEIIRKIVNYITD